MPGDYATPGVQSMRRPLIAHPLAVSLVLVAVVFVVDLGLQLGVASAIPYTFAVLIALHARPAWAAPAVAGLCGVLTIVKLEISPDRGTTEMWKVLANRGLALFSIGTTTLLGLLRRRAETNRELAEERAREHQAALAHMGRLSMLGQVTANLAHELNQPLAAISLQADVAVRLAVLGEPVRPELSATLGAVAEQAARAAGILKGIRRMAGRAHPGQDLIDLNDAVRVVVRLLDWKVRRADAQVELRLGELAGQTFGDRILIEQVIFNLFQNAIEALTGREGVKIVTIVTTETAEAQTLSVRDTGSGLADTEKLFEPFFTTKADGMGLGLAISRTIIEAHGGRLWATPAKSGGAEFSFTLPVARPEES